jgi:hypothetical protein
MIVLADHERSTLKRLLETHRQERDRLRVVLDYIATIGLSGLVRRVLNDAAALECIAGRSYTHSNGFDRITLLDWPGTVRVRLHIWWPEHELPGERIHNHAWNFWSRVVYGGLTTRLYSASGSAEASERLIHLGPPPAGASFGYTYAPGMPVEVDEQALLHLPAGTTYHMDHRVLHRVHPDFANTTGPCVTAIAHGPLVRNASDIVVPVGEVLPESRSPQTFGAEELTGRLKRVLGFLDMAC